MAELTNGDNYCSVATGHAKAAAWCFQALAARGLPQRNERPDGIKIAGFFIALIIFVSLLSRIARTTELRVERFEIDETAKRFVDEAATQGTIRIITNHPEESNPEEYRREITGHREDHKPSNSGPHSLSRSRGV